MAADSVHPDYEASARVWARARDVLAGEDAVKAAGEKYLPKLDAQSEEEYAAYKARASFFGATARTLEEFLDLVFRKAPMVNLPDGAVLANFSNDCDGWGTSLLQYARRVLAEVLSVGRLGSLVLWDLVASQPRVSAWRAEQVLDWAVERVGGSTVLTEVVVKHGEERWVLRLDGKNGNNGTDGGRACVMEIWSPGENQSEWVLRESVELKREGTALPFIPFVFHGPKGSLPEKDKLPLADLIAANLDHYRLDADYKHGLHFAALPTAWVSGFDKGASLRIGSSAAWVSEVPGASAGFLEFTGAGLAHLERAMEKVERRMAALGARMLDGTSEATLAAAGGELCGLGAIVESLNQSLTRVLQLAAWWGAGARPPGEAAGVGFAMNTDLGARAISGEEITAVVAAWRAGAISRESMLERLKRGEVLPDGRSVAQERALIHGTLRSATALRASKS